jgi:hypothetical protein
MLASRRSRKLKYHGKLKLFYLFGDLRSRVQNHLLVVMRMNDTVEKVHVQEPKNNIKAAGDYLYEMDC